MRRLLTSAVAATAVVLGAISGTALADTHAPSAEAFVLNCGGTQTTFVSPVGPAEAAQITGKTGVGILEQVLSPSGDVVFQHQSFSALNPDKLTTCTDEAGFTYLVLVTPPTHH
jgi:hypothetical protein